MWDLAPGAVEGTCSVSVSEQCDTTIDVFGGFRGPVTRHVFFVMTDEVPSLPRGVGAPPSVLPVAYHAGTALLFHLRLKESALSQV